jgi:hypothetical protein
LSAIGTNCRRLRRASSSRGTSAGRSGSQ